MKICQVSIDKVIPYPGNPRKNADAVEAVAASIQEFGFQQPIVVDVDMVVIVGHTRLLAARQLELDKVPITVAIDLTAAQARAYRLADNRTGENAEWDNDLLAAELADLDGEIDLSLTGFTSDEMSQLRALSESTRTGLTPENKTPEPPANPVSMLGDVWLLGKHRLICGDCTDPLVVNALLDGAQPHLMVTDPPYGVEYDPNWRNEADRANGRPIGARATGKVKNDDQADWREAWGLFTGDVAYVWSAPGSLQLDSASSLIACGFDIRQQIIWSKNNIVIGRGHYHYKHEPLWYAVRKGKTGHWSGGRKQATVFKAANDLPVVFDGEMLQVDIGSTTLLIRGDALTVEEVVPTLWNIDKPMKSETGHGTQKPVECMRRPMENNSVPGDMVYDPFLGSGTTIIAAETIGRICLAIELNPVYIDVAVKRWQDFTGQTATRESDGATFDSLQQPEFIDVAATA